MNARDLRLKNDYESLKVLVDQCEGALAIESAAGVPPDQYVVVYRCRSVEGLVSGKPVFSSLHRMRIRLPARYPLPSAPPRLDMLTPLYNPHIYPNWQVCLGEWQTTEYLDELVARVGALIQLDRRILNLRDPANPDAMQWLKRNLLMLPTDNKIFGPHKASDPTEPIVGELPEFVPDLLLNDDHLYPKVTVIPEDDMEWIEE